MNSTKQQDPSAAFTYSDLPDSKTCIRLIRVREAVDGERVHCELSVWSVDSAPPYAAISYTWGSPADTRTIILNGQETAVRTNCEYVLRQTSWHNREAYIWIDALCINQGDLVEKNVQVAIMGDIYKRAELVLACVGPHSDDSQYLFRVIRNSERLYNLIPSLIDLDERIFSTEDIPPGLHRHICRWFLQLFPLGFTRLSRAHNDFFRLRPYFERVWVLQELFMAEEIVVCCGNERLPFHLFPVHLRMMSLVTSLRRHFSNAVWRSSEWSSFGGVFLMRLLSLGIGRVSSSNYPVCDSLTIDVGSQKGDQLLSIENNLVRLFGLQCHDARDMIYATLSMVDWRDRPRILPDYNRSCFQLALEVLGHSNFSGSDLPGWLVEELQLLSKNDEIERRISLLSVLGPETSVPTQEGIQARYTIRGDGYKLVAGTTRPGLYMRAGTTKRSTGYFLGPALESVNAQEGDLALRLLGVHHTYNWMLVAREQSDGYFTLVGYTAFEDGLSSDREPWGQLYVYLDMEDLLMLAILDESLIHIRGSSGKRVKGNKALLRALSRRVCRFEGSSYAVRANEMDTCEREAR